jgi:hypothetical protein
MSKLLNISDIKSRADYVPTKMNSGKYRLLFTPCLLFGKPGDADYFGEFDSEEEMNTVLKKLEI